MAKKICIYCGKEFDEEDMTREHVIPQVMGGNIKEQNPFIINNVCKRCNNVAGIYIDGVFAKQFLVKANIDQIKKRYTDITKNPYIPPFYLGINNSLNYEDKICEMWSGPAGDPIFHFHKPYNEDKDLPMIGKPTYIKSNEIDNGFVFFYIVSNNPVWQTTTANTVRKFFNKSVAYLGHGHSQYFSEIPKELEKLNNDITSRLEKHEKFNMSFTSTLHVNDRFACKLALGMSGIFLKDEFTKSDEAKQLRNGMWAKTPKDFENIKFQGSSFYISKQENAIEKFLNMDNCHVITLFKSNDGIYLNISLWGEMILTICLTRNIELLKEDIEDGNGIVYVVAPGLKKCIGPISLIKFIGFKNSDNLEEPLLSLKQEVDNIPELPPVII